jgi:hypothetical protein
MANAGEQADQSFFAAARELVASVRETVNEMHRPVTEPLLADGMLAAAFRQGVDELWQGLKPFSDTIQAREPGTFLDPLQSEIAETRQPRMTPAEIVAADMPRQPELDTGKDMGMGL